MSAAEEREAREPWTVEKVLAWAGDDFRSRGHATPRLEAELLLGRVLGLDRVRLILEHRRPLSPDELARFRELIKRRRAREPIAYILGEREFYGLSFRVDARVLVPRPDTETLVDVALERTRQRDLFGNMLDLCTGSGCVAIAFAKRRPTWRVLATDVSPGAVELARENALRLGAAHNVTFLEADLGADVAPEVRFDLITANPPYVPSGELAGLEPDIRQYEPALALDGGPDGLDAVRRIVALAGGRLAPEGVLALEVHYDQADRVVASMAEAGLAEIEKRRDYGGHERVVSARKLL